MRLPQIARRVVYITLPLLAVWWVLSGRFDLLHFGTGVLVAVGLALNFPEWRDRTRFRLVPFLLYVPWLTVQVIRSNLRVARSVLSPRLDIAPTFISRRPDVAGERALTLLGCSTTLTPGTLTVEVSEHEIFIHALDTRSARDAEEGVMEERVREVFRAEERP